MEIGRKIAWSPLVKNESKNCYSFLLVKKVQNISVFLENKVLLVSFLARVLEGLNIFKSTNYFDLLQSKTKCCLNPSFLYLYLYFL